MRRVLFGLEIVLKFLAPTISGVLITSSVYLKWLGAFMRCPKCGCLDDKVIDSRGSREGSTIRRRRECLKCEHRFTTYEEIEHAGLMVVKRDGRREEFTKEKLLGSLKAACAKRPVPAAEIEALAENITDRVTDEFDSEVPSKALGEMVMARLRELDKVAYVRYASIYRRFEEAEDFLDALKQVEAKSDTATFPLPGI